MGRGLFEPREVMYACDRDGSNIRARDGLLRRSVSAIVKPPA
jgi:hypothetical protein